jgi:large subunit ribosomal protein L6
MYSKEFKIPENVKIEIDNNRVKVSGEKGKDEKAFPQREIKIEVKDNKIVVSSESERKKVKALVGSIISHINNMVTGVTKGFIYKLKIVYTHFPVTVKVEKDKVLIQNFLGERSPRTVKIVGNVEIKVEGQDIIVSGVNKEEVGQMASRLEQATRIIGYDRRKFLDGCYIISKE